LALLVAVCASNSFLLPTHQVNALLMGPGGYRNSDYLRGGWGDACPVYPGKRYVDWELEDPAGKAVEDVRPIRDDIEQRVRGLMAEIGVTPIV
ncbi:MAG: hypothetical protein R6W79_02865, partial [Acidimicrobiia bacterium]